MPKTAVITGASDGLGKQLAIMLYEKGYNLALCGRNKDKMQEVVQGFDKQRVYAETFDMLSETDVKTFCGNIKQRGDIDILINNAGFNSKKSSVLDIDIQDVRNMLEVNCISQIIMIKELLPIFLNKKNGQIINVLSSCCLFNNPTISGYTASKNAMKSINDILAKEVKDQGVKVLGVYPGGIDTAFRELARPDYMSARTVAKAIVDAIELPNDAYMQELVLRPPCENNY